MAEVIATDARAGIRDSLQQTIVGELVTLVEVDCTSFGGDVFRFHNHAILPTKVSEGVYAPTSVFYGGVEYSPRPYAMSGVSFDSSKAPEPTFIIGNVFNDVTALCLAYDNLLGAKVTVRTTLKPYLDNGANPNPEECITTIWYIASKTGENDEQVGFKLTSPADLEGDSLPSRVVTTVCTWALRGGYRSGRGCGYMGTAMFDEEDNPTLEPSRDICGGFLNSCRIRFGDEPLDFGAFPASSMINN